MTRGPFTYDFGDVAGMTPLLAMFSLGHQFMPPAIHAGGLRYHGMAPLVSQALVEGLLSARAYGQLKCYESALTWARTEGPVPAPETSHAIACVIEEAIRAREAGQEKVILFSYSGHGLLDLGGYEKYLNGELTDFQLPEADLCKALEPLAKFPKAERRKTGKW
jgi:tryptophan synthase beta chain